MRLTARSEYALLALVYVARHSGRKVSMTEIAEAQRIPARFLEQILTVLTRHRVLLSSKGRGGGYELKQPAEKIALAQIVRMLDGALAPTNSTSRFYYRSTPIERESKLHAVFKRVRDQVAEIMEGTTLRDVL